MKFNLSAVVLAAVLYLGMIIAPNIGDGFDDDGPFKIAPITYGLILSALSAIILSKIEWWGLLGSWIGYLIASSIMIYVKYKEHKNVYF
jgi:hypothetical protein